MGVFGGCLNGVLVGADRLLIAALRLQQVGVDPERFHCIGVQAERAIALPLRVRQQIAVDVGLGQECVAVGELWIQVDTAPGLRGRPIRVARPVERDRQGRAGDRIARGQLDRPSSMNERIGRSILIEQRFRPSRLGICRSGIEGCRLSESRLGILPTSFHGRLARQTESGSRLITRLNRRHFGRTGSA